MGIPSFPPILNLSGESEPTFGQVVYKHKQHTSQDF